jgi:hypothetical protein
VALLPFVIHESVWIPIRTKKARAFGAPSSPLPGAHKKRLWTRDSIPPAVAVSRMLAVSTVREPPAGRPSLSHHRELVAALRLEVRKQLVRSVLALSPSPSSSTTRAPPPKYLHCDRAAKTRGLLSQVSGERRGPQSRGRHGELHLPFAFSKPTEICVALSLQLIPAS